MAGVVPVFLPSLNKPCWLSADVTSGGRYLLIIDDSLSPEQVASLADQALAVAAERLARVAQDAQPPE